MRFNKDLYVNKEKLEGITGSINITDKIIIFGCDTDMKQADADYNRSFTLWLCLRGIFKSKY